MSIDEQAYYAAITAFAADETGSRESALRQAIQAYESTKFTRMAGGDLEEAIRKWVDNQSLHNTGDLYRAAVRHFNLTPVIPD
jgi:hypothetical protein